MWGSSLLQAGSGAPAAQDPSEVAWPLSFIAAKAPHRFAHFCCQSMVFRKLKTCFSHKYGMKTWQRFSPGHSRAVKEKVGPVQTGLRGSGPVGPSGRTFRGECAETECYVLQSSQIITFTVTLSTRQITHISPETARPPT